MCDDPPVVTGRTARIFGGRPRRAPASRRPGARAGMSALAADEVVLHGHRVRFHSSGDGPLLVLLHGIASTADTWAPVAERPRRASTRSSPPTCSATAPRPSRAATTRSAPTPAASGTCIAALGYERATVVGHSLGGGIAMQFAYQFPERVERLVLIASGGLGREVHPILRAATLPGSELVLAAARRRLAAHDGRRGRARARPARAARRRGPRGRRHRHRVARRRGRARRLRPHRAGGDRPGGQRVSATDRLYLAAKLPTLIVWGERDPIIPADHGRAAHAAIPGSRLEIFDGAGPLPAPRPARPLRLACSRTSSRPPSRRGSPTSEWTALMREVV